jgi:DNA-binding beta-propeller fold protein YncE
MLMSAGLAFRLGATLLAFLGLILGARAQVPDRLLLAGDGASGYFCSVDASNGFLISIHGVPGRPHQPVVAANQRDLFVLRRQPLAVSHLDLLDNSVVRHIAVAEGGGSDPRLVISPDASRALVVDRDLGRVFALDLVAGRVDRVTELQAAVAEILPAPDGDRVFFALPQRGVVAAVALADGTLEQEVVVGSRPTSLAASADLLFVADAAADAGGDRSLRSFDIRSFEARSVVVAPGRSGTIATAADGAKLLVSERSGDAVHVLDVASGQFEESFLVGARPLKPVVSRDGNRIYVPHDASLIEIVDLSRRTVQRLDYPSLATASVIVLNEDGGMAVIADPIQGRYSRFGLKGEWWDHVFQLTSTCAHPRHLAFARNGPQRGWWVEAGTPGRGYGIERTGDVVRVSAYLADSGRWLVGEGRPSDGRLAATAWTYDSGGALEIGTLGLEFVDPARARLTLPGSAPISIERFDIVPGGVSRGPVYGMPETGWYWDESGSRGFFFEVQGSLADPQALIALTIGGRWYVAQGRMTNLCVFQGTLIDPGGEGRETSPVGPITLQFQRERDLARLVLPGRQGITLKRKPL